MNIATRRLFHTFRFAISNAYASMPDRALQIEDEVRKDAAKAGGADSRGAYTAIR